MGREGDEGFVDFVVVGIFVGAIIVGAGAAVRDLAPRRQPRISRPDADSIKPETLIRAWRRFCQSAGLVMITMGTIIVFATVVGIVFSLSDRTGWLLVGGSAALAAVVIGISAIIVPNHYRRGGFDPIVRTRPVANAPVFRRAVIERDIEYSLGRTPASAADDPFAVEPSTAVPIPRPVVTSAPDTNQAPVIAASGNVISDVPPAVIAEEDIESAGTALTIERPWVEPAPADDRFRSRSFPEPEPASGPVDSYDEPIASVPELFRRPVEQAPASTDAVGPTLTGFEDPLIDPEDELPSWDAPPPRTRQPTRYVAPQEPSTAPGAASAGFESSLFADLDAQADAGGDVSGPFQSNLLNELTRDEAKPTKPVADVLIDEFSLPARDRSNTRDADDNR